jgi:hypothetical protein
MFKSFVFLSLLFFLSKTQPASAQDQVVSIHANNISLPQVLKELEKKSNYTIIYSNDIVTNGLQVSVDMQQRPMSEILRTILEPNQLFYSFRDQRLILIGRKRQQEAIPFYSNVLIFGVVKDDNDVPIAFATVALLKNEKKLTDLACSETGIFTLDFPFKPDSAYSLTVSAIGFQTKTIRFVYPDTKNLSVIRLSRQTGLLKTVTVQANKPMIERQIDRLVFYLSNSIAVQGTDITEALRLTPMVKVTESGLSLIGKGGVGVLINGRPVQLSGTSLMSYLKSLRSDDVERIEVITVPPARYEAQGGGGLINIVIKKNQSLGWSGSLNPTYMQQTYTWLGLNANLNYQSRKISSSLKLRYLQNRTTIKEQNDLLGASSIQLNINRKSRFMMMGANLNVNYRISNNADIGFIYDIGPSNTKTAINLVTSYLTGAATDSTLSTFSKRKNPIATQTLNLYYDQKLDSTGKKLSTAISLFNNIPENTSDFTTISDQATVASHIQTYSRLEFNVWSGQSDLLLPYRGATVETGAKFTHFSNHADVRYYDYFHPDLVLDPTKSNLFEFTETNTAAYLSAFRQLNKKWSTKVGLRYEYSSTRGFSPSTKEKSHTSYGQIFPSAFLNYKPNGKNTFSLAYSKRINRPYLRLVNPFRFYSNPYMYGTGDPLLKPSTTHNLEFSYLYKGMFSLTAYGSRLQNGFGDVTFREGGFIVGRPANYITQYSSGLIATVSFRPYSWWENSSYAQFSASDTRSTIASVVAEQGSGFNYSTTNNFKLNQIFGASFTYSHALPARQNNQRISDQYRISFGLRAARLLNDQLQMGLTYSNESVVRYRLNYKDFTQVIATDYDYQTIRFTATYSFGRKKVRGANKNIQFSEKQRAN